MNLSDYGIIRFVRVLNVESCKISTNDKTMFLLKKHRFQFDYHLIKEFSQGSSLDPEQSSFT